MAPAAVPAMVLADSCPASPCLASAYAPPVADTFSLQKHAPVLPKNAAPHSGALAWVRSLRERTTGKN